MINDEFYIENNEYSGDFSLDLTINSGQTSQPPLVNKDGAYYENISVDDTPVVVKLYQDMLNAPVKVEYFTDNTIDEKLLHDKIFDMFDLNYPLYEFKSFLKEDDILRDSIMFNQGLRIFKAQYPFECIISSICSANNSIKRWTKTIQQIRKHHGRAYNVGEDNYYTFPDAQTFTKIPEESLLEYGTGYRSSQMLNTTQMILEVPGYDDKIFNMNYTQAYQELLKLEGVGPKVADCILLYGYGKYEAFPTDVWINRIMSYLYFDFQKISNKKITSFAQDQFKSYAGYVQLYLFNYARKSGLLNKLKK